MMHLVTPETCRAVAIAIERTFSGFNTYSWCFTFTGTGTTWRSPEPTQSLNVPRLCFLLCDSGFINPRFLRAVHSHCGSRAGCTLNSQRGGKPRHSATALAAYRVTLIGSKQVRNSIQISRGKYDKKKPKAFC